MGCDKGDDKMPTPLDLTKIICFDTETTGLGNEAEILQLSIMNAADEVLFDEYMKPKHHLCWPEAEAVHHISPQMVADKESLDAHRGRITEILEAARYYVGYNILYDIRMLKQSGIPMAPFHRKHVQVIDVMKNFAPIYGEPDPRRGGFKWQNLVTCAKYYDYDWGKDKAHGALADTRATLHCFKKMNHL